MTNVYDTLIERGYVEQATDEDEVRELLANEKITFYIGFDPTADSLHVGHFIQIMVMMHMQKAGHRPIALFGGGTAMIGDPSGRTDMRQMLTKEQIAYNVASFKKQMSRFINFDNDQAIMVNNADWLLPLNYLEFMREVGVHFSVNRMLTYECFKNRMEHGLSFLEFNYMLLQGYDFLELYRRYGCRLQLGGSDQWSNILAGTDLIRRKEKQAAYGLTFKLLTTASGKKMGKTEAGALWLDAAKTPPYDFYQYWRNVDDCDVANCLALLTFLPMDEVRRLGNLPGAEINQAKEVLAYEVTALVHGQEEAEKAQNAAHALFAGGEQKDDIPSSTITKEELNAAGDIISILVYCGLTPSKSEGRRLIKDGGIYLEGERIDDMTRVIGPEDFTGGAILLRKGKKAYHRLLLAD